MGTSAKPNCWEVIACGRGPGSTDPCPAATDTTSDGVNDGDCAGRICWTVTGTGCHGEPQGSFVDKLEHCVTCRFFRAVKAEQGAEFRLIKLGQGLRSAPELHATIARLESFLRIHEDLHAQFDLRRLMDDIAAQGQQAVNAERSVVFLLQGRPPVLRAEFMLRGTLVPVTVPVDESSAVGSAALRNESVNVRDPYHEPVPNGVSPAFSRDFDRQCNVRTHSLLAVPIRGSDGEPIGVITAANSATGAFSADDQWFMEKYALQAGMALEKARLLEDSFFVGRLASFGETMSGLSHCLKGITHALRGITYIVRQAVASGRLADVEAACEILDRQVQRVVDLSVAVAAYDRERSGGPPMAPLNDVVADVVGVLREEARARAIGLELHLSDDLGAGFCERVPGYRCLVNLLCHVLNSCPASGGEVVIATERGAPGEALIEVCQNGPSLSPQAQADTEALLSGAGGDQGIGLPTAARLARAHGGRLEVQPRPSGGTAYRLHLPLSPPPDE